MGKVRVKTIGAEEEHENSRKAGSGFAGKKAKEKKEQKKLTKAPGLKGGERVVSVGPSEEELKNVISEENVLEKEKPQVAKSTKGKKEKFQKAKKQRSARYKTSMQMIDKSKIYSLSDALSLLANFQKAKFDETVELHINTAVTGISGNLTLPHGTGKKTIVAIADDKLIEEIEKNKINFDILIAEPSMMPKLAKVARILGPKGLMPNPKNGTITQKPQDLVKKYEAGQISFKTEAKTPLIHLTVGKFSFGEKKLSDNIKTIISAVKPENIQKMVLKSTMSPSIKISV